MASRVVMVTTSLSPHLRPPMEETVTMSPDLLGTIILAASTVHR